jgi:hypothetical protein
MLLSLVVVTLMGLQGESTELLDTHGASCKQLISSRNRCDSTECPHGIVEPKPERHRPPCLRQVHE